MIRRKRNFASDVADNAPIETLSDAIRMFALGRVSDRIVSMQAEIADLQKIVATFGGTLSATITIEPNAAPALGAAPRPHWTQRPENRARLRRMLRKANRARRRNANGRTAAAIKRKNGGK